MGNPPECYGQRGQDIYYDKLMLGYEEKTLERVLPPTKFSSNKASNMCTWQQKYLYKVGSINFYTQ